MAQQPSLHRSPPRSGLAVLVTMAVLVALCTTATRSSALPWPPPPPPGTIFTFAGSATAPGNAGDGGPAYLAALDLPGGVAVDSARHDVYISDLGNNRVRVVGASGIIANFAGNAAGHSGNSGDGGPATSATLTGPGAVTVDAAGNVYIADNQDNRVRKVDTAGTISNFAGNPAGSNGNSGDGGPATSARLFGPQGLAFDSAGNLYVSDSGNNRVRKVDPNGKITDFAGSAAGTSGNAGDGGPATSATLTSPDGIATDSAGNVFITDVGNNRVRKVDSGGTITNFAGNPAGTVGNAGDGGPASSAFLNNPRGLTIDAAGNIYIADGFNNRIRRVDTRGMITNFAGSPAGTSGVGGDGSPATAAFLNAPTAVAVDSLFNVYVADYLGRRVRDVSGGGAFFTSAASATFTIGRPATFAVTVAGSPPPTLSEVGALPAGVTFDGATSTLRGTPVPGTVGSYPLTFRAANGDGPAATQSFSLTVANLTGYTAVVPVRICDTRAAGPGVAANQCDTFGHIPLSTGGVLTLSVAGAAGVPADATAVVLHVTVTGTNAASWLTVWPTGQARPSVASLNWTPGQTAPNLVETGIGTGGQVSMFNYAGNADVVVDLQGYVRPAMGALFVPLSPRRVCDTRLYQPTNQCNNAGATAGTIGQGKTRVFNVTNGFGVPTGAAAVELNVTATGTSAASYLTVWPDGAAAPLAASLNWAAGQTISNRVVVAVSPAGSIDVFNAVGNTDVVIDLGGYFTASAAGSGYFPVTPTRICDTRAAGAGVASNVCNSKGLGTLAPSAAITLSGFNPIVSALVVNVTVTNTGAAGFVTVFPAESAAVPLAADVTWSAHQTIGNMVVADLGSTGGMTMFNGSTSTTDVIVDVVGYYSATTGGGARSAAAAQAFVAPVAAGHK